ncbi:MAG: Smr/MutS family protein [Spirochaetales bacterium]|nr:Smr/MutS family protein [Spirochaetales bacterium]
MKDKTAVPECDLHEKTLGHAKTLSLAFLADCVKQRIPQAKIITGKDGHGNEPVLMKEIPLFLKSHGYHYEYPDASDRKGNLEKGSFIVDLTDQIEQFRRQEEDRHDRYTLVIPEKPEKKEETVILQEEAKPPLESPPSAEVSAQEPEVVPARSKGKIENIQLKENRYYVIDYRDCRKKSKRETIDGVAALKEWVEASGVEVGPRWEKEIDQWETREKKRLESLPGKTIRYKGHKFKKPQTPEKH